MLVSLILIKWKTETGIIYTFNDGSVLSPEIKLPSSSYAWQWVKFLEGIPYSGPKHCIQYANL